MKLRGMVVCLTIAAGIVLTLTNGCSRNIAGATTETTNGIVGSIRTGDDKPAADAIVRLFPDEYDPVADSALGGRFIDTADANGNYRFSRIAAGKYSVLARNLDAALSSMVRDIAVTDDSLTTVPAETISRSGSIIADFSPGGVAAGAYVYIPGSDISSPVGSDGSALLADVPPGTFTSVILASGNNEKRNVIRNKITLAAGDTAIIDQPLWKYSLHLALNTTPDGADVAGDIYNFPVLIRLDAGNFDFTQARPDGGDLIFTGNGNTSLPHEIERWDAAARRAEIWVKVDTVFGNDSGQSMTMYWGNPDAPPRSASGEVFDTVGGYQGVWHLGEAAGGPARDATVNRYDGTSPDSTIPQVAEGVIGNCRMFDGITDYITMPNTADSRLNFQENGYYTVSAWVFLDTLDNKSHCIVSKGYYQYYLRSTYISKSMTSTTPLWEFVEFTEADNWLPLNDPAVKGEWTLLVGVREGDKQLLYCNGVFADSTADTWNKVFSRIDTEDVTIGRFAKPVTVPINEGYCYFKGGIDEVRIINAAQSPDWVRLCYMNQRPDDRLVVFR